MKFKKIDDTKLQCILYQEDMFNYNITMEDFMGNDPAKIHELLDIVIEEAYQQIGVDMDGTVMSLQLVPQPNQSLLLTISGSRGNDTGHHSHSIESFSAAFGVADNKEKQDMDIVKQAMDLAIMFKFQNMEDVEDFCMTAPARRGLDSALYKGEDGSYYMLIERTTLSEARFISFITNILEYSELYSSGTAAVAAVREHCDVLVGKNAINTVKRYLDK